TATFASLPFGVAAGWLLARRRFRGKAAVETLLNLPLVLPPVVTGYVLLVLLGRKGWVGQVLYEWLGVALVFGWEGAAAGVAGGGGGLGGDGLPADGAGHPPGVRRRGRAAGAGGADAGGRAVRGVPARVAAAGAARRHRRVRAGLRPRPGRIRGDGDAGGQHP